MLHSRKKVVDAQAGIVYPVLEIGDRHEDMQAVRKDEEAG